MLGYIYLRGRYIKNLIPVVLYSELINTAILKKYRFKDLRMILSLEGKIVNLPVQRKRNPPPVHEEETIETSRRGSFRLTLLS